MSTSITIPPGTVFRPRFLHDTRRKPLRVVGQVLVLLLLTAPLWGEWLRDRTRAIAAARRLAARRRHA